MEFGRRDVQGSSYHEIVYVIKVLRTQSFFEMGYEGSIADSLEPYHIKRFVFGDVKQRGISDEVIVY